MFRKHCLHRVLSTQLGLFPSRAWEVFNSKVLHLLSFPNFCHHLHVGSAIFSSSCFFCLGKLIEQTKSRLQKASEKHKGKCQCHKTRGQETASIPSGTPRHLYPPTAPGQCTSLRNWDKPFLLVTTPLSHRAVKVKCPRQGFLKLQAKHFFTQDSSPQKFKFTNKTAELSAYILSRKW